MVLTNSAQLDPALERSFRGHKGTVECATFNPSMKQIASGGVDRLVMLWSFKPNLRAVKLSGHKDAVLGVDFASSGRLLASCSKDFTIKLWQPNIMTKSQSLKAHLAPVRSIQFSGDDRFLISASDDKSCKIWDVAGYRFKATLRGHKHWVRSAVFSPDGLLAASASDDKTVKLWDLNNQAIINTFYDHSETVNCVRFHPDGTLIASCSVDGSVKMWDVRSSKLLQHYDAHDCEVTHIDFHPSGAFLVSSSNDSSLRVWNLTMGNQMYTIRGHERPTTCVSFNPKGDYFASTSKDALVLIWKANFDRLLEDVPDAGRNLKTEEMQSAKPSPSPRAMISPPAKSPQTNSSRSIKENFSSPRNSKAVKKTWRRRPSRSRSPVMQVTPSTQQRQTGQEVLLEKSQVPSELSATLQNMVEQMNLVTQTLGMFEERLSHTEVVMKRIEERLTAIEAASCTESSPVKKAFVKFPNVSKSHESPQAGVTLPSVTRLLQGDEF